MPKTNVAGLSVNVSESSDIRALRRRQQNKKRKLNRQPIERRVQNECPATRIAPEILIEICKHLSPTDLLSLLQTCKLYHTWLSSKQSVTTQKIWYESRQEYAPFLTLPSPRGLDEVAYASLVFGSGCQTCGEKVAKVYWAFSTRMCSDCFAISTVTNYDLNYEKRLLKAPNTNYVAGLPYVEAYLYSSPYMHSRTREPHTDLKFYLATSVEKQKRIYHTIPPNRRHRWTVKNMRKGAKLMKEVRKRERVCRREEMKAQLEARIVNMAQTKDETGNLVYDANILRLCPAYKKVYGTPHYMCDQAWIWTERKLVREYPRIFKKQQQLAESSSIHLS
ncbi:4488_t:CDS:2 [Ambispora gerdemannii]|uniref:4488_t:CDS:1 n=1 Tax=Ambispora gerdemannii TaxID=144530 RepID=A0A9N8ZGX1_9GLOM|nr:4488_t:CDS:2 [Ambispora gerdemannii]